MSLDVAKPVPDWYSTGESRLNATAQPPSCLCDFVHHTDTGAVPHLAESEQGGLLPR